MAPSFDVFLSHNSKDKPVAEALGILLKKRGLSVWLDKWELVPGRPWQEALEEIIEKTRSAAVLVGSDGISPWQQPEMRGALAEFVKRGLPVIPVLLPSSPSRVDLPLFLEAFTWVDFRDGFSDENIGRLVWGITGLKPGTALVIADKTEPAQAPSTIRPTSIVQEIREHVCPALLANYGKIRLLDDTRIDIDRLYVDVYVLERVSSRQYASIPILLEAVKSREDYERLGLSKRLERKSGHEIIYKYNRTLVLGKPGSGKTTFLRHLAVDCSKGRLLLDHVPFLVELRTIDVKVEFNLFDLLHHEFGLSDKAQTKQLLSEGKALILLDGFDEVPEQSRMPVKNHIYEFTKNTTEISLYLLAVLK